MKQTQHLEIQHTVFARLEHDGDLLEQLTALCRREGIRLGRVEAIGAVKRARIGYYHQDRREYQYRTLDQSLEILALTGNVSVKDGEPMVHAHITLANAEGEALGGHLAEGTIVFACECLIQAFAGDELTRALDAQTGLPLWTGQ